jgi:hypothetical protein
LRQTGRMFLMVVEQQKDMQEVLDFLHSMHQFLQLNSKSLTGVSKK